jgi:hypothetical protein
MSQGVPGELFVSYSRGWRDGACSRGKDPRFTQRTTRPDLREAYLKGYDVGHDAYGRDLTAYAAEVGYDIAQGVIDR